MRTGPGHATRVSTIPELLRRQAEKQRGLPSILGVDRRPLTYDRLHEQVELTVAGLRELGIGRPDRVAMVLPNGPDSAVAFLATASVAASVPLNPAYGQAEFQSYLTQLGATALLVQEDLESPARDVARSLKIPIVELSPLPDAEAGVFTLRGTAGHLHRPVNVARPEDVAVVLQTSGTTARPKVVALTHGNLCATVDAPSTRNLLATDRCLLVTPMFYIQGIGSLLMTLASGTSVVCAPGFDASRFIEWLATFRATWYPAGPTIHQTILARAMVDSATVARCQLRFIRSGTAPLPPAVKLQLESVFSARVDESYGMTETCGRISCNPPPPAARKPGSVGTSVGPEIAIVDNSGARLPSGGTGEIIVRGANVIQQYESDPELNATSFLDGWLRTGDFGYLDADGYLFVTGRLKEIINRGGEKVSPGEVEAALLAHPAIAEVAVFAVPDRRLGEDVGAAVVLRAGASATERELREFVARRLVAFKRPGRIVFRDAIPKGPTGKVSRLGLADRLGVIAREWPDPVAPPAYLAPRTPLEELIAGIWAHVLGLPRVGIDDRFLALGGDSILATQVAAHLRDATGLKTEPTQFLDSSTVAELALMLTRVQLEERDPAEIERLLAEVEQLTPDATAPVSSGAAEHAVLIDE